MKLWKKKLVKFYNLYLIYLIFSFKKKILGILRKLFLILKKKFFKRYYILKFYCNKKIYNVFCIYLRLFY